MARWPAPRRCKSRLAAAGLGPLLAARLQQRLLAHALAVVDQCAAEHGLQGRLALAGAGPAAAARLLHPCKRIEAVPQGSGGLGERMVRQLMAGLRQGYQRVVLVGSDLPRLQSADLQAAFAALEQAHCVVGPARDGGYWLLGLSRTGLKGPVGALFAGVDWGSDRVLQQSLARADQLGLAPLLLPVQSDLDRAADLLDWR